MEPLKCPRRAEEKTWNIHNKNAHLVIYASMSVEFPGENTEAFACCECHRSNKQKHGDFWTVWNRHARTCGCRRPVGVHVFVRRRWSFDFSRPLWGSQNMIPIKVMHKELSYVIHLILYILPKSQGFDGIQATWNKWRCRTTSLKQLPIVTLVN